MDRRSLNGGCPSGPYRGRRPLRRSQNTDFKIRKNLPHVELSFVRVFKIFVLIHQPFFTEGSSLVD